MSRVKLFKWPIGKFNGRKVQGFSVKLRVRLFAWSLLPVFGLNYGEPYFHWLCLSFNFAAEYE